MTWKQQLVTLENNEQWDAAIEFMQKTIAENPHDMDAYILMCYLIMNLLVEEDYDTSKNDHYEALAKKYFDEGYAQFSNNPEFLFYIGIMSWAEWYFGLDEKDVAAIAQKAFQLEPTNILYQWGSFKGTNMSELESRRALAALARKIVSNDLIVQKLKDKGAIGPYLLGIFNYEITNKWV